MDKRHVNNEEIKKLEDLARLMDSQYRIPGTGMRFGWDSLLGLVPGLGDTVTLASTIYLIGRAHRFELPWYVTVQMVWNALIDWLIGLVPLLGDIFDVGWKANNRNVALIKKHLGDKNKDTAAGID